MSGDSTMYLMQVGILANVLTNLTFLCIIFWFSMKLGQILLEIEKFVGKLNKWVYIMLWIIRTALIMLGVGLGINILSTYSNLIRM